MMKLKRWHKVGISILSVLGITAVSAGCQIDLYEGRNFNTELQWGWDPFDPYLDTYMNQGESWEMAKMAFSKKFNTWDTVWAIDLAFQAHGDGEYGFNTILMYQLAVPFVDALWDIAYWAQFAPIEYVDCLWYNVQGNPMMGAGDYDVGWRSDGDQRCRWT